MVEGNNFLNNKEFLCNLDLIKKDGISYYDIDESLKLPIDDELSELTYTSIDDLKQYPNWIFYLGTCYYLKENKNLQAIFNELIGSYFFEYMDLPTIKYDLAMKNNRIVGLISKNFKNGLYTYYPSYTLSRSELKHLKKMLTDKSYSCDEYERIMLTNYLFANFLIANQDRNRNSQYAKDLNGSIHIAPTYDYESALIISDMDFYSDPLISWQFDNESVRFLKGNNQYTDQVVSKLYEFNINKCLQKIVDEKQINIPLEFKKYYQMFFDERKKTLTRIGLK